MQTRASGIDEWLDRVRGEYLEMPGLRLTLAQAAHGPALHVKARALPLRF